MKTDRSSIRPASFAATATTLLALLAMTSMTSTASSLVNARADLHSRTMLSESHMVRAMAAVMAAAARDMLVGDQHVTPIIAGPVESLPTVQAAAPSFGRSGDAEAIVSSVSLDERLLDLPPPVC